jgi:hypothetical protein
MAEAEVEEEQEEAGTAPSFGKDLPLGKFAVYERAYALLDTA